MIEQENKWWEELTAVAARLYQRGPLDRHVWSRADGDIAELELGSSPKANWFSALRLLKLGGGGHEITVHKLLQTMLEDYPSNETLQRLFNEPFRRSEGMTPDTTPVQQAGGIINGGNQSHQPVEIFFSYVHEDETLMDDVRRQLVLFDQEVA